MVRQTGWSEHLLLLGKFLRSPRTVGAIAPSSRRLARQMVHGLELERGARVVELGPGTGAFTREIIGRLGPDSRYLGVDVDPAFVERLRQRWPQLDCVCAPADALVALAADRQILPVDHIVSGLPFASLPFAATRRILAAIAGTLRIGGTFTTFQYVHAFYLPAALAFRRETSGCLGAVPTSILVVGNLPPAFVLTWRRAA